MKKLISLIFALLLTLTMAFPALAADSSVIYDGDAQKFVFLPGSWFSNLFTDTDLFDNFKNVMPGDTVTQKITLKNKGLGRGSVSIYLRAEAHDETANPLSENVAASGETVATMSDFLSKLSMVVRNGEDILFSASPDQLDGLKENVLLGTLSRGQTMELTVELQVPIELDNRYANRVGEVDWIFTVEEIPTTPPETLPSETLPPETLPPETKPPETTPAETEPTETETIPETETEPEVETETEPETIPAPETEPEETEAEPIETPQTGDDTMIWPYILLLAVGIVGAFVVLCRKKEPKEKQ